MSSTSFRDDVGAYVASRLAIGRVGLLWVVLSATSYFASTTRSFVSGCSGSMLAAVLIVQLRLWDDLVDRTRDALLVPRRLLVVTDHLKGFTRLCATLAVAIALLLLAGDELSKLAVYAALLAAMAALYSIRLQLPLLRAHLVLLKYPVLVWLCARDPEPGRWGCLGAAVYLALSLFDIGSTKVLRNGVAWRWVIALEVLVLAALLLLDRRNLTCRNSFQWP